jgi:hypothetical protein
MGNNLETVTASRDAMAKENDSLKAEIARMKSKKPKKKASGQKHRKS